MAQAMLQPLMMPGEPVAHQGQGQGQGQAPVHAQAQAAPVFITKKARAELMRAVRHNDTDRIGVMLQQPALAQALLYKVLPKDSACFFVSTLCAPDILASCGLAITCIANHPTCRPFQLDEKGKCLALEVAEAGNVSLVQHWLESRPAEWHAVAWQRYAAMHDHSLFSMLCFVAATRATNADILPALQLLAAQPGSSVHAPGGYDAENLTWLQLVGVSDADILAMWPGMAPPIGHSTDPARWSDAHRKAGDRTVKKLLLSKLTAAWQQPERYPLDAVWAGRGGLSQLRCLAEDGRPELFEAWVNTVPGFMGSVINGAPVYGFIYDQLHDVSGTAARNMLKLAVKRSDPMAVDNSTGTAQTLAERALMKHDFYFVMDAVLSGRITREQIRALRVQGASAVEYIWLLCNSPQDSPFRNPYAASKNTAAIACIQALVSAFAPDETGPITGLSYAHLMVLYALDTPFQAWEGSHPAELKATRDAVAPLYPPTEGPQAFTWSVFGLLGYLCKDLTTVSDNKRVRLRSIAHVLFSQGGLDLTAVAPLCGNNFGALVVLGAADEVAQALAQYPNAAPAALNLTACFVESCKYAWEDLFKPELAAAHRNTANVLGMRHEVRGCLEEGQTGYAPAVWAAVAAVDPLVLQRLLSPAAGGDAVLAHGPGVVTLGTYTRTGPEDERQAEGLLRHIACQYSFRGRWPEASARAEYRLRVWALALLVCEDPRCCAADIDWVRSNVQGLLPDAHPAAVVQQPAAQAPVPVQHEVEDFDVVVGGQELLLPEELEEAFEDADAALHEAILALHYGHGVVMDAEPVYEGEGVGEAWYLAEEAPAVLAPAVLAPAAAAAQGPGLQPAHPPPQAAVHAEGGMVVDEVIDLTNDDDVIMVE